MLNYYFITVQTGSNQPGLTRTKEKIS